MSRPFLTVLATPIPPTAARIYAAARRAARAVVKPHAPRPAGARYPGHHALVRSVVEGLRAIDADFNFDPRSFGDLAEVVYAPANEALRQAALLKRQGRIRTLVTGPANVFLPHECDNILLMPEIDVVIVASDWVRVLYDSIAPSISHKIRVCPAGVDTNYWAPATSARTGRAVVYWKDAPEGRVSSSGPARPKLPDSLRQDVERVLRSLGVESQCIRYGSYDVATFKQALAEAPVAVFLSTFEPQGLALAEAWAMDVPTLVWDPQAPTEWAGQTFIAGSSAPYLTPATGRTWKTLAELESTARDALREPTGFSPRAWVLSNMTDAICAAMFYRIVQDVAR